MPLGAASKERRAARGREPGADPGLVRLRDPTTAQDEGSRLGSRGASRRTKHPTAPSVPQQLLGQVVGPQELAEEALHGVAMDGQRARIVEAGLVEHRQRAGLRRDVGGPSTLVLIDHVGVGGAERRVGAPAPADADARADGDAQAGDQDRQRGEGEAAGPPGRIIPGPAKGGSHECHA